MSDDFPKEGAIPINGIELHYRDWGGQGRPVVLLHGLASHSGIWDLVAPLLATQSRVVALARIGYGAVEGYVSAPGVTCKQGELKALRLPELIHVIGHGIEVVAVVRFAAPAVTPKIQGHDS